MGHRNCLWTLYHTTLKINKTHVLNNTQTSSASPVVQIQTDRPMKIIPKKLNAQLLEFDQAVLNEDALRAMRLVEDIDWKKYNTAASANLPHKQSVSVLRCLLSQDTRFCLDNTKKNTFFENVFKSALSHGFDPYTEEFLWDVVNNTNSRQDKSVCKKIARMLDATDHTHLQYSSFLKYVCTNYLVQPWLLKYTLSLPSASVWVENEETLFDDIWEGQSTGPEDEKDIRTAHRYLLDAHAPISSSFVKFMQWFGESCFDSPNVEKEIKNVFAATKSLYEKRNLLNAIQPTTIASPARKM